LKVNIPSIRTIDQNNGRVARSDQRRPNLNDETCRRIILRIKSQSAGRVCRSVITINARQESLAAKINSAKIVSGRKSQAGEVIIGSGEVGMSLRRYGVTGVECTIGNDAGPEAGDSSAGTDSDAAGNLTGSGIGDSRSAQNSEIFGRSECLRLSLSCKSH
jgi:hypothetical protein